MLSIRTNILLDKEIHALLITKAREEKKSIGALIRNAIIKTYKQSEEAELKRRTKVVAEIMKLRKKIKPLKGIDCRELIEYGRYR